MGKTHHSLFLLFTTLIISSSFAVVRAQQPTKEIVLLKINKEHDKRTVIKPSAIPNAGNGLFARVKIKEGEVIGELGGQLVSDDNYPEDSFYIAAIPECAREKTHPYKYIDSKEHGANVSRINFAPSEINGVKTGFQNAAIKQLCEAPYFIFVAVKDIEAGAEIWSSYGDDYDYDSFMKLPEVRDFFCGLLKIDCREQFTYAH
jgi:SET domain-containing protein